MLGSKKRLGRWRFTALLGALLLIAAACATEGETTTTAGETPDATAAPDTPDTTAATAAPDTTEAMSDEPIVIGGSLALSGFLSPTAAIHKVAGDLFIEELNAAGGLLGRPVVWDVRDDESAPDNAAAIYERLITEEQVDLILGPYGTGTITAAMAVAEENGYVFPHHTASLTYLYTYACHFPTWPTGVETNITNPNLLYDALDESGNPPETIGFVMNTFPGTQFIADGPPETDDGGAVTEAAKRGYEVVLDIDFPTVDTNWDEVAALVKAEDPDFLYVGALGVNGNDLLAALDAIDYAPRGHFYQWPAPGPLLADPLADHAYSVTTFEMHSPFMDDPENAAVANAFAAAAEEAGLPYTDFEAQASASWVAWQVLAAGVEGAGSLDHAEICAWLIDNPVDTVLGVVDFDPAQQNYYGDLSKIKQIQDGAWLVVSPSEWAAPDTVPLLP